MKFDFSNPWLLVRWAVVVFLFAGTVLVAMDQVKTRDARIAELEERTETAEWKLREAVRLTDEFTHKGKEMSEAAIAGLVKVQSGLTEAEEKGKAVVEITGLMVKAHELQVATLEDENAKLRGEVSRLKLAVASAARGVPAPTPNTTSQAAYTRVPYTSPKADEVEPPWWKPPLRRTVDANIRAAAVEKWKDNYDMVEYEINRQSEAYEKLLQINKDYRPATKRIIAKAAQKWGENWNMVVYEIDRQSEALSRLNGK